MKVLWLTWKDRKHPLAGGAEVVNEELARRLVSDGHEVKFLVGGFAGAKAKETINGYKIIRLGNRVSVYWRAYRYYRAYLRGWADLVIDEVNTMPFFAKWYVKETNILFVHMLCRRIWFYQLPLPLSLVGYLLEPFYLRLLADRKVITVSESTKRDLMRHGFKPRNIVVISEGIELSPIKNLLAVKKYIQPTVLSFGAIRPMKRTRHQIRAFEIAKKHIPTLKLVVAGDSSGRYGQRVLRIIGRSAHDADIEVLGKITKKQKAELLQKCHVLLLTSVKEGWGLVVTEAASQGTPSIVYDVDGLRDSVRNGLSGYVISRSSPQALASKIVELMNSDATYEKFRHHGLQWSRTITFKKSYANFRNALRGVL